VVSNRKMPQYLLGNNRKVTNDLETGELYDRRIGPWPAGHEAAISQDLPFGLPIRCR
jgi:hypothetical protein